MTRVLNVPNSLTMLRMLLVPLFGWLLLSRPDDVGRRLAVAAVFVVAIGTDALDGRIARSRGLVTNFGKLADPIADKALTGMGFVGLSIVGELWWWVTVLILLRELAVTLLRFVLQRAGIVMAANRSGKLKTFTQSVALGLMLLPLPGWWQWPGWVAMAAALVLTLTSGIEYFWIGARLHRDRASGGPVRVAREAGCEESAG